ncbi:MAG TPA: hypothetical protein VJ992_00855 [Gemmatimonadales bacterium]|nr:hypothetical protein [Gemmatimonadales bacterium]
MTGTELGQRRLALGLSLEDVAGYVGEHPEDLRRYETITGELPGGLGRRAEFALAAADRRRRVEAEGLICPEVRALERDAPRLEARAIRARLVKLRAHERTCDVCRRRAAYEATLPPLPGRPLPAHYRLLRGVARGIAKLPHWARPAAVGALLVGALALARGALALFAGAEPAWSLIVVVFEGLGIGAYGGMVGGAAYALARAPTRPLGRIGDYLTGIACVYAYLLAFGVPALLFHWDDATFDSPVFWILVLIAGAVIGLVIGDRWFGTPRDD